MNVVFRADASIQIGTGHVMRCLTLADELRRQGHDCRFICRDHPGHLSDAIVRKGFTCDLLSDSLGAGARSGRSDAAPHADWLGVDWQTDAGQTLSILTEHRVDWLVADHYALDFRWERQLASVAERIMVIDDLADRDHECDLLLDQNLGTKDGDYAKRVPEQCVRLIGPHYALLRPEFSQLRQTSLQRRVKPEVNRILISLGGVDSNNTTSTLLKALAKCPLPDTTELDIVMGATAPHLDEVKQVADELPFPAEVRTNVTDMAERMSLADISIGAAGSTSWERCCLGLPSIMVVLAENQRGIASALANSGCAYKVEASQVADELCAILSRLVVAGHELENMANKAKVICDGQGSSRLVSEMIRIAHP